MRLLSLSSLLLFTILLPRAHAQLSLEVGYMPILPVAQVFVIEGEGWAAAEGLELNLRRFSDGPTMVKALLADELDVAYVGIGPAMVARARGVPLKVVAAAVKDHIGVVVQGKFADYTGRLPMPEAIARFTAEQGRKPVIASFPAGSVPNTVLRYWLVEQLNLSLNTVEIRGLGANAVLEALLAGEVDGAAIMEPILTAVRTRIPEAQITAWGRELLANHPGAVLTMTEAMLRDHPHAAEALVGMHIRATEILRRQPERAARHAQPFLGDGNLPLDTVVEALRSPVLSYLADPRRISGATVVMHNFQLADGTLREPVPLADLFEFSVYQAATRSGR